MGENRTLDAPLALRVHDLINKSAEEFQLPPARYGYFRWSPGGDAVAFLRWGRGFTELWMLRVGQGPPFRISDPVQTATVFDFDWIDRDDRSRLVAFSARLEAGQSTFLVTPFDIEDEVWGEPWCRLDGYLVSQAALSHGGTQVAIVGTATPSFRPAGDPRELHRLDLETGELTRLSVGVGIASHPVFAPDDSWVAWVWEPAPHLLSATHREIHRVPSTGGPVHVVSADFPYSIGNGIFGADEKLWVTPAGKQVVVATQQGMADHVLSLDIDTGRSRWLTHGRCSFKHLSVARDGRQALAIHSAPQMPEQVTLLDLQRSVSTVVEHGDLPQSRFAVCRTFSYHGDDDTPLEGLLIPGRQDSSKPGPLVVALHGGSFGRHTFRFNEGFAQSFAHAGYSVFLPNPRGSAGYDQEFSRGNLGRFGEEATDVLAGVEALVDEGLVDPSQIFLTGSSYGAYLGLETLTRHHRFRAAALTAPVSDWRDFYETSDLATLAAMGLGGTPEQQPRAYREASPIHRASQIRVPVLFFHGEWDRRVPVSQSRRMHERLQDLSVPTEFHLLFRQGHVFQGRVAQTEWLEATWDWFRRH